MNLLDCDKGDGIKYEEDIERLSSYSMLTDQEERIYSIMRENKEDYDAEYEAQEKQHREEIEALESMVNRRLDSITKAMENAKNTLTEKQYSKVKEYFDKVAHELKMIEQEVGYY